MVNPPVQHLYWRNIAPESAFHAALFAVERIGSFQITPHDHDFAEVFLVTEGEGTHIVNGRRFPLTAGTLWFIRPSDVHTLQFHPGGKLHWINVAFPLNAWNDFAQAAELSVDWGGSPLPPTTVLRPERLSAATSVFETALRLYVSRREAEPPSRFALCRFLSQSLAYLPALTPVDSTLPVLLSSNTPDWLREACNAIVCDTEKLAVGLPALRAATGISNGHLARTLKAVAGQTPTEFINTLRLSRAAELLTTTALPIVDISAGCGFAQLSYFYRLFTRRYKLSPHAYRRAARQSVVPSET